MSDLSLDLVEEILTRVLITSLGAVRSTCKLWNALSKDRILCKAISKHQHLGFMMMDYRLCSMRFNLHGIFNQRNEKIVDISIYQVHVSQVYYCDGLLLCLTKENNSRLVVWNPYLGQTRWIQPKNKKESITSPMYALGYDNNKNHKILRLFNKQGYYEIYDFKSSSWRVFNVIPNWDIDFGKLSASVDGNTYFWARERIVVEEYDSNEDEDETEILICFDFTKEKFGQYLPLPFQSDLSDTKMISCVKENKLAVLNQDDDDDTMLIEIWITTKIEPNAVLWVSFLKIDMNKLDSEFFLSSLTGTFFIDEEKRVAVTLDSDEANYSLHLWRE